VTVPLSPPRAAAEVFADRLPLAQRYADLLARASDQRGLLGPRELPRLWDRHILNCAVLTELLPDGARVVDVGTGPGLPGLVLACRRADLRVDLVESMQRRIDFLREAVDELGLEASVRVIHGRAEDPEVIGRVGAASWVTARAVAPLDRLVRWCLPLLRPGGTLLALKGASAIDEVTQHRTAVSRLGGVGVEVVSCGHGVLCEPVAVVVVRRAERSGRNR
jgi:16S rRNA (guanine527-N7)-methyltransferase